MFCIKILSEVIYCVGMGKALGSPYKAHQELKKRNIDHTMPRTLYTCIFYLVPENSELHVV